MSNVEVETKQKLHFLYNFASFDTLFVPEITIIQSIDIKKCVFCLCNFYSFGKNFSILANIQEKLPSQWKNIYPCSNPSKNLLHYILAAIKEDIKKWKSRSSYSRRSFQRSFQRSCPCNWSLPMILPMWLPTQLPKMQIMKLVMRLPFQLLAHKYAITSHSRTCVVYKLPMCRISY